MPPTKRIVVLRPRYAVIGMLFVTNAPSVPAPEILPTSVHVVPPLALACTDRKSVLSKPERRYLNLSVTDAELVGVAALRYPVPFLRMIMRLPPRSAQPITTLPCHGRPSSLVS